MLLRRYHEQGSGEVTTKEDIQPKNTALDPEYVAALEDEQSQEAPKAAKKGKAQS